MRDCLFAEVGWEVEQQVEVVVGWGDEQQEDCSCGCGDEVQQEVWGVGVDEQQFGFVSNG